MPRAKLEVRQFIPEITPFALIALMELVAEYGVAPERLCEGMTFSPKDLLKGMLVSNRQAWRMIRRALRLTGRADLGLELGRRQDLSYLGLSGVAMTVQSTFGEAAAVAMRDQKQNGSLVDQTLVLDDASGCAVLIAKPRINDASVQPFLIEELFTNAILLSRGMLAADFAASAIEFAYPAPAYVERYREQFCCPMTFDCAQNRVFIDQRWLAVPLPGRSPMMAAELESVFKLRASSAESAPDIVTTVASLLVREDNFAFTITQAARMLDVSVRTLRRRLDEGGTSFRQLSERVRAKAALELLRRPGSTVSAVSEQLGFSDARAFRRAFKRWQGYLPSERRHTPTATV